MGKSYTLEELTKMVDEHREALNRVTDLLVKMTSLRAAPVNIAKVSEDMVAVIDVLARHTDEPLVEPKEGVVTTKDIHDAIEAEGWMITIGAHYQPLGDGRTIVTQCTKYGYSSFEVKTKGNSIVGFKPLITEAVRGPLQEMEAKYAEDKGSG